MNLSHSFRTLCLTFGTLSLVLLSGCGDDGIGETHPVEGKVLFNGKPIEVRSGYVSLVPDTAKGNTTQFAPAGTIEKDGSYVIYTKTREGAPPGWYKVVVTAKGEVPKPRKRQRSTRPLPKSLVPAKYGQGKTTPLSLEVVESPATGAYDLNVKN